MLPRVIARGYRRMCTSASRVVQWVDCGSVDYRTALAWQLAVLNRRLAAGEDPTARAPHQDIVLALEHPHVYTLGRSSKRADLKFEPGDPAVPAAVLEVSRGGQITYHGPGQLVVYPLLDLTRYKKDLHWYVTTIEDVIIDTLGHFGLQGGRMKGLPGVWVGNLKIAQVGMNVNKWFTTHGFALNVCPDMSFFGHIIPCGIADKDKGVASLHGLLAAQASGTGAAAPSLGAASAGSGDAAPRPHLPTVAEVARVVAQHFLKRFDAALAPQPRSFAEALAVTDEGMA